MAQPPRSILVVSLRYHGDALLTTPLIRSLRRAYDAAAIDVLLIAGTEGMLEGNPDVRDVLTIGERAGVAANLALARRLWRRYGLAVIAETGDRPWGFGWAVAPLRAGLLPPELRKRWWKTPLARHAVSFARDQARLDAYRRLCGALGIPFAAEIVTPTAGTPAQVWRERLGFDPVRRAYAVIQLAPRFRYKRWHAEGWRALIAWLHERGLRIAVTGGAEPDERAYAAQVLAECTAPVVNLSGRLRYAETADLLRGAALYVGPDTATSHLAAACGTRAVVLFGPTDPRLWGPVPRAGLERPYAKVAARQVRANVALLQEDALPCVPCQQEGCDRHAGSRSDCLDRIAAERVIDAAREALDASAASVIAIGGAAGGATSARAGA